ncbi:hypothetical protein [Sphingomonas profundi]|uniref:hypothetical protein n=1 Tax=Alterirhizorhabdus profundi TaxID=2681549 RepID=UPI0012E884EE|nr:hypothetical protein [Sphingomonas profundi]
MADKLGVPTSSYARYEDANDFKKPHLPLEFARKVAVILADRGIDPADVMALAGVGADEFQPVQLSASEERLVDRFRGLDAGQRRLLLDLAEAMGVACTAPSQDRPTIHSSKTDYRGDVRR